MKTLKASGVGAAINRVEGRLKVMGMAKYASEFPVENIVYAQGINSTIAKGEIISVDTSEAEKLDGVLAVITHKNSEKLKTFEEEMPELTTTSKAPVLQSPKVRYYGEFIGVVIAETFEQAQYAARLVKFEYKKDPEPTILFDESRSKAYKPKSHTDYLRGDMAAGLAEADETLDHTYSTPIEHHHPMELHAVIASWENAKVTAYASQQIVEDSIIAISDTFQIPKKDVRVISAYVGGDSDQN